MSPAETIRVGEETSEGGRIFFSNASRSLIEEDEIELTSVGVDIGSSTSHLLFSTIRLERLDTRYVVSERSILHQSDILLTPYIGGEDIDAAALGTFIDRQYEVAGLDPGDIDTGALILTGVAVRRGNARAIGELFSAQAGKFVAVSAGDGLETLMAAHASGALAQSAAGGAPVMNIDIGGGTTKIALCAGGDVESMTALEAGARLLVFDDQGRIERIEPFGRRYLDELGLALTVGDVCEPAARRAVAGRMAERIMEAAGGADLARWLRLPPLGGGTPSRVTFSGGVSEYIYGREAGEYHDLGPDLGAAVRLQFEQQRTRIVPVEQGIRATVVGASQYTVQVSGSTIFLDPPDILPVRNIPAIAPDLDLSGAEIDQEAVTTAIAVALARMDLGHGEEAVAVTIPWQGSASFQRLRGLSRGVIAGLRPVLEHGHPLILVVDGDIGGLFGMHCRQEEDLANPVISIDGIELNEFDFIDIGEVLRATGAVPVVIKSLLFPGE
jgi:ethanolamine utilization protein EutA